MGTVTDLWNSMQPMSVPGIYGVIRLTLSRLLNSTAWVQSLNRDDGRGENIQILSKTRIFSLHDVDFLFFFNKYWLPFVRCVAGNKPKVKFIHRSLTTQNITQKNNITSHPQNNIALQPNVILTGIHRLLATQKCGAAFLCTKCQDQL